MSRTRADSAAPTMIIPRGAEIRVNSEGQLSIRTPGNLVLQGSGTYGELESLHGSLRVEPGAEVEAVTVRCADACVVAGSLTAWKVAARVIQLEDDAKAQIVLHETEKLEIGPDARLTGNFASEKELFLLFSRFARQLRAMPLFAERRDPEPLPAALGGELPLLLRSALQLLEEDSLHAAPGTASERMVGRLAELLHTRDLETLAATHRTLFARVDEPSTRVANAAKLVAEHFEGSAA
jgi:hypothetical protein